MSGAPPVRARHQVERQKLYRDYRQEKQHKPAGSQPYPAHSSQLPFSISSVALPAERIAIARATHWTQGVHLPNQPREWQDRPLARARAPTSMRAAQGHCPWRRGRSEKSKGTSRSCRAGVLHNSGQKTAFKASHQTDLKTTAAMLGSHAMVSLLPCIPRNPDGASATNISR